MSRWRTLCAWFAASAALVLSACGSETGSGGDLTEDEVTALVEALTTAGVPLGADQFLLAPLLTGAELGTIGDYDAIGAQVDYTVVNGAQEGSFRWVGVTGWSGFDAGAGTVTSAVGALYAFPADGFPAAFDETIANGDVVAWSYQASPATNYYPGETGTFAMSSASFGAPADCPEIPELGHGVEVTECRVSFGTMQGSLGFSANRVSGTGPESFALPEAAYDLPATRLVITIDFTGAATGRRAR
ncbi:MAG TPA: hypothetical protein VFZ13_11635 [Gemmatimonadales bacterium]